MRSWSGDTPVYLICILNQAADQHSTMPIRRMFLEYSGFINFRSQRLQRAPHKPLLKLLPLFSRQCGVTARIVYGYAGKDPDRTGNL